MAVDIESYASAPLVSGDHGTVYFALSRFWQDVHALLNDNRPSELVVNDVLKLAGLSMGADRAYTFSVTGNRLFSSCTSEWTRFPDYELLPLLQNIDQRELRGWLHRFDTDTTICIEDVDNPPEDLKQPAAKFKRDLIKSIYVFGFYDEGRLVGYFGIDYVRSRRKLDDVVKSVLVQLASTLNLYLLRHETLEIWKQIATTMPSAMFVKDADNDLRYVYANPRYRQLYGDTVVGKNDLEIFGKENGEVFREQDRKCLNSGVMFRVDGSQYDYSKRASGYYSTVKYPVITRMGHRYLAGFISDISAEHAQRMQALELLEKSKGAEQSKSRFLAAMSHEIRTPLNAIIGFLDELRHTDIPEATRAEYVDSASTASRALLALLDDVLDISKLESGRMHMTAVETDLAVVLGECESIFAGSCREKGIDFRCEVPSDLPVLLVDTTRLRQVLFNLISNAVKFTVSGEVRVLCGFERTTKDAGTLSLEVRDTGIGISAEDQRRIFDMFEQASKIRGTSVANKGTGLGLYLCKNLVAQMNGDIRLKSEIGKGSVFEVVFTDMPFVENGEASESVRHRQEDSARIAPVSRPSRVLIVDDVLMNLKVLEIILGRMNIETVSVKSGEEALARLAEGGFSHVLTDIWMDGMDGETLARKIRENHRWDGIRIAAQTADVELSDSFDTSLFDAVLSKPLTPEKVHSFISRKE